MRTKSKVLYFVLALLCIVALFGYIVYKNFIYDGAAIAEQKVSAQISQTDYTEEEVLPPEYYGLKRAEIALAEYRKDVVEQRRGCNCGPEIDKYTEGTHVQWCTMFASWVGHQSGSGVWNHKTDSWRIVNSRDFAAYLEEHGTWHSREEVVANGLEPQIGDYVVFWRGDFEDNLGHVDIVVKQNDTPGTAGLVGGNLRDRIKYRDNFPYLQNYGFLGFGRPEK